jgi:hypothetical protein
MGRQQSLRGAGADPPCTSKEGQKSLAAQPRREAPHRVVELRNRIISGRGGQRFGAPPLPKASSSGRSSEPPSKG